MTVDDALRAIQYAHLCVLLIDATAELHKQDLAIARLIADEGRALVIGANKWDAVDNKQAAKCAHFRSSSDVIGAIAWGACCPDVRLHKRGLASFWGGR